MLCNAGWRTHATVPTQPPRPSANLSSKSLMAGITQSRHSPSQYLIRFAERVINQLNFQFLRSPNMSFDMAGSLTSTPTHSRIATSTHFPPNAQSTPVTTVQRTLGQVSILNTPDPGQENQASAHSTPKLSKFSPTGPNSQQRQNGEAPRTPTPFKRALAEVHRRREPLSNTPQTPTKLVDDINDIIKKDMLDDIADLSYTSPVLSSNQQVLLNSIKL